ncbi:2-oxoglutarate dehydrogenase E1 component [Natronospira bacteriovora]|uniref:oxoglutarate dehydrogenase (succinyl-transferring) n=1 Tax=Natronospira bacteriovora TaxID=3069753 RepID=A0ABU0W3D8_9GAMM|nr:2-oxoglutarate dehydrogenase E1 component [Natronospira sp. AB-CW4]MDQ2068523.1 2-oxoglutarate dehydrogenase E1 component [Natronospira sp. AB-CW4]
MTESLEQKYASSHLFGANAPFLLDIYEKFLEDPDSVPEEWRNYFRGFLEGQGGAQDVRHGPIIEEMADRARAPRRAASGGGGFDPALAEKQAGVARMIQAYRGRGHRVADIDPLGLREKPELDELQLSFHGLGEADLDTEFSTAGLFAQDFMKLRDIIAQLQRLYTGSIGFEYMHVTDPEERRWLQERFERGVANAALTDQERKTLLLQLTGAEGIERYLHKKYVGQKRFSLEGGEALIPMLDDLIQRGGEDGLEEIVVGMAHRGRINVLINVLGKSPEELFSEFEGIYDDDIEDRSGDVKYHMGFSSDLQTPGGDVHVALAFNPSHLEFVNAVVEGSVRARQDRRGDDAGKTVMPVLIHGDASFAGQGIVQETLQMSQARGFYTGGTVHITVNNQVGFTTSHPRDARSTPYATDVAKMIEAPILHVNADDPEAVIHATRLALEYRQRFHKDVMIDLVCYRRHGHNEADEPAVTQPEMYGIIRSRPSAREIYAEQLSESGVVTQEEPQKMLDDYRSRLDAGKMVAPKSRGLIGNEYTVDWSGYNLKDWDEPVDTTIDGERVKALVDGITRVPENFKLHSRVQRIIDDRVKMGKGDLPMDWGFAETMAHASLLTDGYAVRIAGQDSGRGTFFHRHARLLNQEDNAPHIPLQHLSDDQQPFYVYDSLLSEQGVVGFEYGYSTTNPDTLVIWEAQFGDFANGAQVIIDQFISSGEAKWGRYCGLVMFLPHGYEGQGPEHSSARLERYLQLCGQHNMQVCVPSTPAQMFHMLRRQMVRKFRKPLIVLTPKSLLRHKLSTSPISDLEKGRFHTVIPEVDKLDAKKVRRIVFCSGKVYYDLLEARRKDEIDDVAVVRIEQLYPFPQKAYREIIKTYANATEIVWCQEEPKNQGAWYNIRHRLQAPLGEKHSLRYVGRATAASTAAGYFKLHLKQQQEVIESALSAGSDAARAGAGGGKKKTSKKAASKKKGTAASSRKKSSNKKSSEKA